MGTHWSLRWQEKKLELIGHLTKLIKIKNDSFLYLTFIHSLV